jgi:type IV pilus assembly protein PilF
MIAVRRVLHRFGSCPIKLKFLRSTVLVNLMFSACLVACTTNASQSDGGTDRITSSDESAGSKRATVRLELAMAYFSRGQYTTALDEVKLAIQAEPNMAPAYNLRGLIYAALGDTGVAEESFQRALQINPRDGDTMHNLGWFLCQQRRYPDATTYFARALEQPQYAAVSRTLLARGVCEARAGQWPEAELTLKRAYDIEPGNAAIAVNLAQVFYQRGEFDRARFYVRRVNSAADQANAQTLWLAARIEKKLGNSQGVQDFGQQLRERFSQSRESSAFDRGQFDE